MKRLLICLALAVLPWSARAFDLDDLQRQLRATPVVRGHFVQQKFLRSLPQPLTSRGDFTLAAGRGLLWLLRSPIAQDLRISADGIARRGPDGAWQGCRSMPAPAVKTACSWRCWPATPAACARTST
ncbi:outer membrane lipoprotein carrier protein LolA [Achromobacter xylosoxidans]